MATRNQIATKKIDIETQSVTFTFSNGKTVSVSLPELSPEMIIRNALHGVSQKGGDSYAGAESVDEAFEACAEQIGDLKENKWTTRVGGALKIGLLVSALARVLNISEDDARTRVEAMPDETKQKVRKNDQVKATMDAIKAERSAAKLSAGGAGLADLLGLTNTADTDQE